MSTYRLDRVFSPCSVALIGASPREKSVGRAVLKNLRDGGWSGPLHVINPKHRDIDGVATLADLSQLSAPPDLVIISSPPATVPDVVAQSAQMGVGAAIIITAGLGHGPGSLSEACEQAARLRDYGWSDQIASGCSPPTPVSTPALRRACRPPESWR